MHRLVAWVGAALVSVPALASAQELGQKGDVVFSAERLLGVSLTHSSWEEGPIEGDNDYTSVGLGWRSSVLPFDVPRVGFDFFVIDHLSVGGTLGFFSTDPDTGADFSGVLLGPRVGYAVGLSRVIGLWPRGGFTYHSGELGGTDENGFALTLECPFTFAPTEHFAFHVGPTVDFDLVGEIEVGSAEVDHDYRTFGLNAGLLGWF
jgi:hypothetical protein